MRARLFLAACLVSFAAACASGPPTGTPAAGTPSQQAATIKTEAQFRSVADYTLRVADEVVTLTRTLLAAGAISVDDAQVVYELGNGVRVGVRTARGILASAGPAGGLDSASARLRLAAGVIDEANRYLLERQAAKKTKAAALPTIGAPSLWTSTSLPSRSPLRLHAPLPTSRTEPLAAKSPTPSSTRPLAGSTSTSTA